MIPGSANALLLGQSGAGGYEIERSLRFNSSDSAHLSRTPSAAGNRKKFTWAGWVKRSAFDDSYLFSVPDSGGHCSFMFNGNTLKLNPLTAGYGSFTSNALFRDPSSFYHIVLAYDSTLSTAADRIKLYVNGAQQTFSSYSAPTQNIDTPINNTVAHYISKHAAASNYANLYLADVHFIDGQALAATDFGAPDDNGVWQPKKYNSGSYGTNGFHLDFADNSSNAALGTDTSGNSNTWTVNNLSVTAGTGNDSLRDSPSQIADQSDSGVGGEVVGNYATWNPLIVTTSTFSEGNLKLTTGSGVPNDFVTLYTPAGTGRWYWEFEITALGGTNYTMIGMLPRDTAYVQGSSQTMHLAGGISYYAANGGINAASGAATTGTAGASFGIGDVIGWAFDAENGTLQCYKNGASQGTQFTNIRTDVGWVFCAHDYMNYSGSAYVINFGQRPFAYQNAGTNRPSADFKCLCTANLDPPTIADPSKYFDTKTYVGNQSVRSISTSFSPDLVWIKDRGVLSNYQLLDSVRGAPNILQSDQTVAEITDSTDSLTSFNSDGFTLGANAIGSQNYEFNKTGNSYVAWAWDAADTTESNTDGTITSQVRASPESGFSIVKYTYSATGTVGHGLNAQPHVIIQRPINASGNWYVYLKELGYHSALNLNTDGAPASTTTMNNVNPTSTVFTTHNWNAGDNLAYCFAPVEGYSSFGSFTGNGSSTDGPFVGLDFKPALIIIKRTGTGGGYRWWGIFDSTRNSYNGIHSSLYPNVSNAEYTGSAHDIDFLSNGFKLRNNNDMFNKSGENFIYLAFAEHPFKTARAR